MKNQNHIIERNINPNQEEFLNKLSAGLSKTIDFGAQLIDKDFSKGGDELDLPPIMFLRNILENMEGISVMIRHSIVMPASTLLRTTLENFFSLEYLLIDDQLSNQRSLNFLVWNFVEQNKGIKCGFPGTAEYQNMAAKYAKDKLFKNVPISTVPDAEIVLKRREGIFILPGYREAKQEYDRTKAKMNKNPAWYSLNNGPCSIEQLAGLLGYPAIYETLYRGFSVVTHGNNVLYGNLKFDDQAVAEMLPIQTLQGAASTIHHCMNICRMAYMIYVQKRASFMVPAYNSWIKESSTFMQMVKDSIERDLSEAYSKL